MRNAACALWAGSLVGVLAWFLPLDVAPLSAATQPPARQDAGASPQGAVIQKYCVSCHNTRTRAAGLALDEVDITNLRSDGEVWEKVASKLRRGEMPPKGRSRPDPDTMDALATWLETSLDTLAKNDPQPGRPLLHRLNRTEYANAIRDLLAVQIDADMLLPPDNSTHGFDNIADALGVSPLLLESYVSAGRKISRLAIGNPTIPAVSETYRGAHDETQDDYALGMPLGTRGGLKARHQFPLDGEYEIRIRLERSQQDLVRGLQEPHDLELALDGSRVNLFRVEGGPNMYLQTTFDGDTPALRGDEALAIRVPVKAGIHEITATFPVKTFALTETLAKPLLRSYRGGNDVRGLPGVSDIIITGPYGATGAAEAANRRRIFGCYPKSAGEELTCAKAIVSTLARRAYRGQSTDADVLELLGFYKTARRRGGFDAGIESALWRILSSPKFVFRFEYDPADRSAATVFRIPDLELASRLSFFLWSSIPDDELLRVATRGDLKNRAALEQQVRRMLADPRAKALVDNFAGQWLYLRSLDSIQPDLDEFPNFDNNLRQAFRRETELFFQSVVREDRSVLDLLNADYTFVNERLARHYGIPGVRGSHFRRVAVGDENRRGLLGHGSILMATSYANRTSPVVRGKWVLENILGAPPPPPPADVPDLPDTGKTGSLPIRQRMAEHRKNPVCASCHANMDPIGFSLENYDAVGAWRTVERDLTPIDASGTMPNGAAFTGPAGLRKALLQHPNLFVETVASKMLTYALGRGMKASDGPAIRDVAREAASHDYAFSSLILAITTSTPFQWKEASVDPIKSASVSRRQ